ncbi:response regulator [Salicola sp. Rm-C-2C1-2]|uniref:response regulator n=1 Tax=Salicola sp. Rm-C-2C1-2 TaxID=3141321 RepID=UPI0032E51504
MTSSSQAKLQKMRNRFITQLPSRWGPVERAWQNTAVGSEGNLAIRRFHEGLHTLIGTSGTLGLTAFSERLRKTEQKLKPYLQEEQLPQALIVELRSDMAQLSQGISAMCASNTQSYSCEVLSDETQHEKSTTLTQKAVRVLVIDDQESVGNYYITLLESAGFGSDLQTQASKVRAHKKQFGPQLLVMDIQMPDISGIELARLLRADEHPQQTPIVFLSAEGSEATAGTIAELGSATLLGKGLTDQHFLKHVSEWTGSGCC